jgi:serine protease AprX
MTDLDRRTFVKGAGTTAAVAAFGGTATATPDYSTAVVDDQFDPSGGVQNALVVFDDNAAVDRLADLDLVDGYYRYEVVPIGFTRLRPGQVREVADWSGVRRVKRAVELEWYNDHESREMMNVDVLHHATEAAPEQYRGEGMEAVVIDSGIDAAHPGLDGNIGHNYKYVDELLGAREDAVWVDVGDANGDTDTLGHGTHCAGILGGHGGGSVNAEEDGYRGMAPDVTIHGWDTDATLYLPYVVSAWDQMLAHVDAGQIDPVVVSNSYGVAREMPYNPNDPVNVASWEAYKRGVLPVFALGNDYELGTANRFSKAPHVIGVSAYNKDERIADFSSRGQKDFSGLSHGPETYYDREETLANLEQFHAVQDGLSQHVVTTGSFHGRLGPGVNDDAGLGLVDEDTGSNYHRLETKPNADVLTLDLSVEPQGQWVRTTIYEGDVAEENRVAMMGEEPVHQHRQLTVDVSGSTRYIVEVEPEVDAVVEYTIEYETVDKFDRESGDVELDDIGPVTLWRADVGAHGRLVISTIDPEDNIGQFGPLYAGGPGGGEDEAFYTRLDGTSMACPAVAGIAVLVFEAYERESGERADPMDVTRIVEAAASRPDNPDGDYAGYNIGTGMVDAAAAVDLARDVASGATTMADVPTGLDPVVREGPPDLAVGGSRTDDGRAFTGGQTDYVRITVDEPSHDVTVTDEVPAGWSVDEAAAVDDRDEQVQTHEDGSKTVTLGAVAAGETTTLGYMARAPSGTDTTGSYTFGPATAETDATTGGDGTAQVAGTDTNYVVGPSQ